MPHACAGSFFNRGKILGMLGREEAAQEAYAGAVEAAYGVAPGSYAKALTSLREYGPADVAAMEDAALYLQLSGGVWGAAQ